MDRLLGEWGVRTDSATGRRQLEKGLEQRRELERSELAGEWKRLRRGWCWGSSAFREELLEIIAAKRGQQHYGEELAESDQQKAERLVEKMLRESGWTAADLERRRKGDRKKARMAARLRAETTMTWEWIAQRLGMGHWRTAANVTRMILSEQKRKGEAHVRHTINHL